MHSRSTFLPRSRSKQPNKDRPTYNPQHSNPHSNQTGVNNAKLDIDKMATNILDMITKLDKGNSAAITKEQLKNGGAKVFYDVLLILLNSIDGDVTRAQLTQEMIIDLAKFNGFRTAVPKTIFQPLGAPHTWKLCLQLLEFFSRIAGFMFHFEQVASENNFPEDLNQVVLKSLNQKNPAIFGDYISQTLVTTQQSLNQCIFTIESKQLAIKNLNSTQKDLKSLNKDLQKEKQTAFRCEQEVIQIQQNIANNHRRIGQKQQELQGLKNQDQILKRQIENVKYQIEHQDMTAQECQKAKLKIRETKERISLIKDQTFQKIDRYKENMGKVMQKLAEKTAHIKQAAQQLKSNPVLEKFKGQIVVPTIPLIRPDEMVEVIHRLKFSKTLPDLSQQLNHFDRVLQLDQLQEFGHQKKEMFRTINNKLDMMEIELIHREKQLNELIQLQQQMLQEINVHRKSLAVQKDNFETNNRNKAQLNHNIQLARHEKAKFEDMIKREEQRIVEIAEEERKLDEEVKQFVDQLQYMGSFLSELDQFWENQLEQSTQKSLNQLEGFQQQLNQFVNQVNQFNQRPL